MEKEKNIILEDRPRLCSMFPCRTIMCRLPCPGINCPWPVVEDETLAQWLGRLGKMRGNGPDKGTFRSACPDPFIVNNMGADKG